MGKTSNKNLYSIGITGGIGSGKSAVSSTISSMGYRLIDADKISHDMTQKSGPAIKPLAEAFGSDIVTEDGELKRKKLASIVFNNAEKNALLQDILTTRVIDHMAECKKRIETSSEGGLLFFDIPLMFEMGCEFLCDEIWLVVADDEIRIQRLMKRDDSSREEIINKFKSQMPQEEKIKLADRIIENNGTYEELRAKVEKFVKEYAEERIG